MTNTEITQPTIISAGYVCFDNEAIWGVGETADAAWDAMKNMIAPTDLVVRGELSDEQYEFGGWTYEDNFHLCSASAALIAEVDEKGGAICWQKIGGVACTQAEYDDATA